MKLQLRLTELGSIRRQTKDFSATTAWDDLTFSFRRFWSGH